MTIDVTGDVRGQVRTGPMSAFQVMAVTICMVINMLDGFDVQAIAFAGPKIAGLWRLQPEQLGFLFSSGLAGMMAGSLVLSPLADIIGRRATTIFGLIVITAGMAASAYATDLTQLAVLRAATGLGIGTLLSSINTIVVEYSSAKRQDFAVAWMAVGFPIGGTIGGPIAIYLIGAYGWPSVFLFGAAVSAVIIPVALIGLPESLDFLLAKRRSNALARINALLRRMHKTPVETLPPVAATQKHDASFLRLFDRTFALRTVTIVVAYFFTVMSFYFMINWTPKVLVDEHLSLGAGISGAVLINAGGVLGGLVLGWFARHMGLIRIASLYMVLVACGMTAFGYTHDNLALMAALAAGTGFFMIGSICSLYAITGAAYPVGVRNTGTGLVIGFGRAGGILGPYLGGVLIQAGWARPEYYMALAIPSVIAAIVVLMVSLDRDALVAASPARA